VTAWGTRDSIFQIFRPYIPQKGGVGVGMPAAASIVSPVAETCRPLRARFRQRASQSFSLKASRGREVTGSPRVSDLSITARRTRDCTPDLPASTPRRRHAASSMFPPASHERALYFEALKLRILCQRLTGDWTSFHPRSLIRVRSMTIMPDSFPVRLRISDLAA